MTDMAIVKASYTNKAASAKASIRYIENRPGKDNAKMRRTLWGIDGSMTRQEAYRMIDEAQKGSVFFRFVISPDPMKEDTHKDIFLQEVIEQTMYGLEDRFHAQLQWVAATHDDHAPHRHVHILAVLPRKLQVPDLKLLRERATEAALDQRRELDATRETQQQREQEKDTQWELQR